MKYVLINKSSEVTTISLNRPDVHNAFNDELITELTEVFEEEESSPSRLIVLTGIGKSFCAGADLNWMSSMINYSEKENEEDSKRLYNLFDTINRCSKVVIGKANGHALGGGVGLLSVCDFVIAKSCAKFGFTEVKLGLIPAVISPFVIAKIGESAARAYFLSGDTFSGLEAKEMGLIHKVSESSEFEDDFNRLIDKFLLAGPSASVQAKKLIKKVISFSSTNGANIATDTPSDLIKEYTCSAIAKMRVASEGQVGMNALLSKKKPSWVLENKSSKDNLKA